MNNNDGLPKVNNSIIPVNKLKTGVFLLKNIQQNLSLNFYAWESGAAGEIPFKMNQQIFYKKTNLSLKFHV
jgi:hypothetical protein